MLLFIVLKSTAVLGAAWLMTFFLRRRSAAGRHMVWTAAFAALLALPFLSVSLPVLSVPMGNLATSPAFLFQTSVTAGEQAVKGSSSRISAARGAVPKAVDWRMWMMLIWAAGAVAACAPMAAGWVAVWRLRRRARPFSDLDLCQAMLRRLGIRHPVEVLETEEGSMPMTFGIMRSAVFLPSDANEWSEDRLRAVLLHELAHVRRGDLATQLLARVALTLYWWNPLAWMAWREFLREREQATDDLVLNAGTRASEYASHLLEVARSLRCSRAVGWAAIAMARRSQLEGRLAAILDERVRRATTGPASAWMAAVVAVALMAPFAALRAQDPAAAVPADVEATIRSATAQRNYEILDDAAKAAMDMHQFDTAQRLLDAALAVRASKFGQPSVEYGLGLLKQGDLKNKGGDANELYAKALAMLGDRREAAPALTHLGVAALGKKDFAGATQYFERMRRVDPSQAGLALMWLAVVQQSAKNMDEAARLYQDAVSVQDAGSKDAATILRVYGQFLREQGKEEEAARIDARVAAMQSASVAQAKATARPSGVYRIGGEVKSPKVLEKHEPEYSDEGRAAKLSGTVVLAVEIGTDGRAHNAQVVRGLGLGLDEKAMDAISQWRFQPGTKDGQPVTVAATIEINWRLL